MIPLDIDTKPLLFPVLALRGANAALEFDRFRIARGALDERLAVVLSDVDRPFANELLDR
jgi:hypothetical protein